MSSGSGLSVRSQNGGANGSSAVAVLMLGVVAVIAVWTVYTSFRIDVGSGEIAVLIRKTGKDLTNGQEVAPAVDPSAPVEYKGVQRNVLTEGRYFYNPYVWSWQVIPQIEIASGEMGVKVSLTGDDLGYGEFLARVDETGQATSKGIVAGVLNPGRYPINPYLYAVEIHKPVTIPAGFTGVVTNLAAPLSSNPNRLLVEPGERGVQKTTLEPGTHYVNPYLTRVDLVDCRSQRFNLGQEDDMGFPSKDGFWVSLDGAIEFRVSPEKAAEVYVLFNRSDNGPEIDKEIVQTVIMPNARSFCRLQGSNSSGREFISGQTRTAFQESFEKSMKAACEPLGIEVIQALITKIRPPEKIADPVRLREIAKQQELQYKQQTLQQESEKKLAFEKAMVEQKQALVAVEQKVIKVTTQAMQEQEVAVTKANEDLAVAQLKLEASIDEAAAIDARGKAAAGVVRFDNQASAAGWRTAVEAFGGDGQGYAQYVLYQKLSASYRRIMVNTADSPIMRIFESFADSAAAAKTGQPHVPPAGSGPASPELPSTPSTPDTPVTPATEPVPAVVTEAVAAEAAPAAADTVTEPSAASTSSVPAEDTPPAEPATATPAQP
jgi:regulator of protease activity HflC (stomatin/prohibitin superfamily)